MNAHSDKAREASRPPVANGAAQRSGGVEAPVQCTGERVEDIRLRELRELAAKSPQVSQLETIRQFVHASPQVKQAARWQALVDRSPQVRDFAALQALADHSLAGTATPIQRENGLRIAGSDPAVPGNGPEAAESARAEIVQREIDKGKFNVVGEDHRDYPPLVRAKEAQEVTAIFGEGGYHIEDSFSAIPDVAAEGTTEEDKDLLQTFASKADSPVLCDHPRVVVHPSMVRRI